MNNFFKSNQPQGMAESYYPQPIFLDEETGKIKTQNFSDEHNFQSPEQQNNSANCQQAQQNFQQNQQKNSENIEKLMSMLKGGNSSDMLSALLANGMKTNNTQNSMMAQALSKLLTTTKKSGSTTPSNISETSFNEM